MATIFDLTSIDQIKQIPVLQSMGEVIEKFQLVKRGVKNMSTENSAIDFSVCKHQDLYAAIMSIKSLNSQLENLIYNIKGELNRVEEKEQKVKTNPGLVEVLNEGQFFIKEYVDLAHEQIMLIEELLFRR